MDLIHKNEIAAIEFNWYLLTKATKESSDYPESQIWSRLMDTRFEGNWSRKKKDLSILRDYWNIHIKPGSQNLGSNTFSH